MELETLVTLIEDRHPQNIAGQKIRRELDSLKTGLDRTGQRFCHRGLAGTRHIFEEHMPTAGNRREQLANGFRWPLMTRAMLSLTRA